MPVELEQIFEGAYFRQEGRTIRIQERDFCNITTLCGTLEPILLSSAELSLLGFSYMNHNTGTLSRASENGKIFWLKAGTGSKWLIGIGEHLTDTSIDYIHQLQRLFFCLYEEHIRYSNDKAEKKIKETPYKIKPYNETVFVDDGPVDSPKGQKHRSRNGHHETLSIPDEPYYLTTDCRLLIRTGNYAIWRVSEKNPAFEYKGRRWGLTLVAGKTVTEEQTISAWKWLQSHVAKNNISI